MKNKLITKVASFYTVVSTAHARSDSCNNINNNKSKNKNIDISIQCWTLFLSPATICYTLRSLRASIHIQHKCEALRKSTRKQTERNQHVPFVSRTNTHSLSLKSSSSSLSYEANEMQHTHVLVHAQAAIERCVHVCVCGICWCFWDSPRASVSLIF